MKTAPQSSPDLQAMIDKIAQLDRDFEDARGWGSWMVMAANERERLVNRLATLGHAIPHKWQARCGGRRTD